jgi:[ribosomal protein S5]-alanine N-acetyltransferase
MELIGERVFLRFPRRGDEEEFIALNLASAPFYRGLAAPPISLEQFMEFLKRSRQADCVSFFIRLLEDNSIIGSISLSQIFYGGFQSAYLGYYVGAAYANRGYMSEALQLTLRYAFEDLKLHRLEANIQPGNTASIALVKRAGFVREGFSRRYLKICGRWRDHERWAILFEDWKSLRRVRAKVRA